jgi:hypothetical protein
MNKQGTYTVLTEISSSLLAEGNILKARADGYSMYPFIRPGSMILLAPVTDETVLAPGEIIAWKRESGFVLHRLISIVRSDKGNLFITRGDSCLSEDMPVQRAVISGKVISVEDRNGRTRSGDHLIARPCYTCNSLRIWLLFKMRRLLTIFGLRRKNEK